MSKTRMVDREATWLKSIKPVIARVGFKDRRLVLEIQFPSKVTALLKERLEKPFPPAKPRRKQPIA